MKKLISLLTIIAIFIGGFSVVTQAGAAFTVKIEDANFERVIRELLEKPTGNLYNTDLERVLGLDASYRGIKSVKGIEYMTNLEGIDLTYNQLTSVDLSKNTNLQYLYIENNNLQKIDLTQNPNLIEVSLRANINMKEAIFKGGNYIEMLFMDDCSISFFEMWRFHRMETLSLPNNNIEAIYLDGSTINRLEYLDCSGNKIHTVKRGNLSALRYAYFHDNKIKTLDMSGATHIKEISVNDNPLENLNLSSSRYLEELYFSESLTNTLKEFSAVGCPYFENGFSCEWVNLEKLSFESSAAEWVVCNNLPKLYKLNVGGSMKYLNVANTNLVTLDLTSCNFLEEVYCNNAQIRDIKIFNGRRSKIETLVCYDNKLTSLDTWNLRSLKNLMCGGNNLTELYFPHNEKPEYVEMMNMEISNLSELLETKDVAFAYTQDGFSYCSRKSDSGNILLKGPNNGVLPYIELGEDGTFYFEFDTAYPAKFAELANVRDIDNIEHTIEDTRSNYFTGEITGPDAYAELVLADPMRGDLDANDEVNLADIVALRNLIMNGTRYQAVKDMGDLDDNGENNLSDIVLLRNIIMGIE